MSEERQIEDIAKILCRGGCEKCIQTLCADWYKAERIYEAGYRKQSEVVDEFARELKEFLDDTYSTGEDTLIDICDLIDHIVQKMKGGVE